MMFEELKTNLERPLAGMGISFSSSLFGLAGSLVLGFLDLQAGQAQNRFYNELEDWLSANVSDALPVASAGAGAPDWKTAIDRLQATVTETGGSRAAVNAMANLAEGIQALVHHMRSEQQMIRDWAEAQAARDADLRGLLERIAAREDR